MKLIDLEPHPQNPRKITEEQLSMLKKSLVAFGDLGCLVYNRRTGHLIGGHQRLKVLPPDSQITEAVRYDEPTKTGTTMEGYVEIGGDRFKYREVDVDEPTEKAMNIAANQHGGEFDMAILPDWLNELDSYNIDLDLLGFSSTELEDMMAPKGGLVDDDKVPEVRPNDPRVKPGDIFILGNHRLMCGDSVNMDHINQLMNGTKADMVFTDPPYNFAYGSSKNPIWGSKWNGSEKEGVIKNDSMDSDAWILFFKAIAKTLISITNGPIYACHAPGPDGMRMTLAFIEAGIHWSSTIILYKDRLVPGKSDYQRIYEGCFYGWSEGSKIKHLEDRTQTDVWEYKRPGSNDVHPTMKPLEIMEKAISHHPHVSIVADIFGGSGSTMLACEKMRKKCFMMELDPQYCAVILDRYWEFTGNVPIRENDQKPWSQIA